MKHASLPFLMAGLVALGTGATSAATEPVAIAIDAAAPGKPISPDLFGVFFEDLNYAGDGGLYAELVQNRSFEYSATEQRDWNEFTGWQVVALGGAKGNVAVRSAKPVHPNNTHYLSIEALAPGDGYGVANAGIDGIPVRANEGYELTFFARQAFMGEQWGEDRSIEGRPMPMVVRLEGETGEVIADGTLDVTGAGWRKYAVKLVPTRTDPKARLVLLIKGKGAVTVDEVSLFPENTFNKRKNGLRADLAQTIADLKPKFMRFPGGCLAHGDGLSNVYHWKNTIGPVEQRKGQRDLWGYHQSVGLGYYEFFQFCEDIGAKPLPVLAAGVCCQFSDMNSGQVLFPMESMPAYIQDVLDLIEWANGPVTSTWGAKRAAAGHPAPFGLHYIGIGNEDAITPGFKERFKMIQDAIRAHYPDIVVIGTVGPAPDGPEFEDGWAYARQEKVPMIDEHYYRSPDWFWSSLHRYDNYDRHGPKVYVGEYAAHEKDRRNTLRTALAEAAGCVSFELNGDVVRLSSYAPLLARRGHTQWTPDLIYFTGTEVYPSINYQVQRLFGLNSGDSLLSTKVRGVAATDRLVLSAVRDSATGDIIVKVVNDQDRAIPAVIDLGAAPAGGRSLKTTVLTAASADVVNEDGQPSPAKLTVEDSHVNGKVEKTFAAHSFTVLRLH